MDSNVCENMGWEYLLIAVAIGFYIIGFALEFRKNSEVTLYFNDIIGEDELTRSIISGKIAKTFIMPLFYSLCSLIGISLIIGYIRLFAFLMGIEVWN